MKRILFLMAIIGMSMIANANEMTTATTTEMTNAVATDTVYPTVRAKRVHKTPDGNVRVEYANGEEVQFTRVNTGDLTTGERQAILDGRAKAVKGSYRTLEGFRRSRIFISAGGGVYYTLDNSTFAPVARVSLGVEHPRWAWAVSALYTRTKYEKVAEATGSYNSLSLLGRLSWKVRSDLLDRNYFGLFLEAGYGYQKTDGEGKEIQLRSKNYGLVCGAGITGVIQLHKNLSLCIEGEYLIMPSVPHATEAGWSKQRFDHGGPMATLSVVYRFNHR